MFAALHRGPAHATAEQVHRVAAVQVPGISLKTVYQALHELTELGELVTLDLGAGSTRYDQNLTPHHHLLCEACGAIVDLPSDLTHVRYEVADLGMRVNSAHLVLRGSCASCTASLNAELDAPPSTREPHRGERTCPNWLAPGHSRT
ncbi:MAG: transcriptional repressor [Acidimicrobiales bacterium]